VFRRATAYPSRYTIPMLTRRNLFPALAIPAAMNAATSRNERFVGITVMPDDYHVKGIRQVLRKVKARAGATAVATSPYVMQPSDREHKPAGTLDRAFSKRNSI